MHLQNVSSICSKNRVLLVFLFDLSSLSQCLSHSAQRKQLQFFLYFFFPFLPFLIIISFCIVMKIVERRDSNKCSNQSQLALQLLSRDKLFENVARITWPLMGRIGDAPNRQVDQQKVGRVRLACLVIEWSLPTPIWMAFFGPQKVTRGRARVNRNGG